MGTCTLLDVIVVGPMLSLLVVVGFMVLLLLVVGLMLLKTEWMYSKLIDGAWTEVAVTDVVVIICGSSDSVICSFVCSLLSSSDHIAYDLGFTDLNFC